MKTLKTLSILFLSVLIISCSKKDDGDDQQTAPEPEFRITIIGGSFGNNYLSELGNYTTDSTNGLTIALTDSNTNVIRIFMNETGGFASVIKEIGNVDDNGFVTNVVVRDQDAMITYTSTEGTITILENSANPENSEGRLISGTLNVTASTNTGETIVLGGPFENIAYN